MPSRPNSFIRICWLALLVTCLSFFPSSSISTEPPVHDAQASYTALHKGVFHLVSYRQHAPVKVFVQKQQAHFMPVKQQNTLYLLLALIVSFLFIVQTRLKWIILMPIKYGSKFVDDLLKGMARKPERRLRSNEIYKKRSGHDSGNDQRYQGFFHRLGRSGDRFVRFEILHRIA